MDVIETRSRGAIHAESIGARKRFDTLVMRKWIDLHQSAKATPMRPGHLFQACRYRGEGGVEARAHPCDSRDKSARNAGGPGAGFEGRCARFVPGKAHHLRRGKSP